jgi:hypothetical protein
MSSRLETYTLLFGTVMNLLLVSDYLPIDRLVELPKGTSSRLAGLIADCLFGILM